MLFAIMTMLYVMLMPTEVLSVEVNVGDDLLVLSGEVNGGDDFLVFGSEGEG